MNVKQPSFVFFGTPDTAREILEGLKSSGFLPSLIVTNRDKPQGRKLIPTPTPVKMWAQENNIQTLEPEKIDEDFLQKLSQKPYDFFLVVAYGKILPKKLLDIPTYGSLNVHYSLLPKYRGASPIESQILSDDKEAGVSIMLLDEKMDHGPILAQEKISITPWPPKRAELFKASNEVAIKLLGKVIPDLTIGKIVPKDQDHNKATYTKKFTTKDAEIDLSGDSYQNFLKIQAFSGWLPVYFFIEKNNKKIRVIVKDADFVDGKLILKRVIPEGKKEMDWDAFNR